MIAVAVDDSEKAAASEFFELCKIPWEYYVAGRTYSVVLSTSRPLPNPKTDLWLIYSSRRLSIDERLEHVCCLSPGAVTARLGIHEFPIYGRSLTFGTESEPFLSSGTGSLPMIAAKRVNDISVIRIGYDLFVEISYLLCVGQPSEAAMVPTLEVHIQIIREAITRSGLPFVEIVPKPEGAEFICCLTHDIDHPVLKNHWMDRTMAGFVQRASVGSALDFLRGRRTLNEMLRNFLAAAELPLLRVGVLGDRWTQFESYLKFDPEQRSTFFFIPVSGDPGRQRSGIAPAGRACRYTLDELRPQIERISSKGCEIALHGLDSWLSEADARRERAILTRITGAREIGVRMHWLYFDKDSPAALDHAGFTYDSSFGYNNAVGFRAGTTQVFRPLKATNLLELPLNVMDTALFYPCYLNLTPGQALERVRSLVDDTSRYGGVLTLNWHDRSIFPERLWDRPYKLLLDEIKGRNVWFATASMSVAWFRKRRAARIEVDNSNPRVLSIRCNAPKADSLPGLRIRVHKPRRRIGNEVLASDAESKFVDFPFNSETELKVAM